MGATPGLPIGGPALLGVCCATVPARQTFFYTREIYMWKKFLLILVVYFAGFFSAVYLLGPSDLNKFGMNYSRAEVLACKAHIQLRKLVKFIDEKASKVGNKTAERFAKR